MHEEGILGKGNRACEDSEVRKLLKTWRIAAPTGRKKSGEE